MRVVIPLVACQIRWLLRSIISTMIFVANSNCLADREPGVSGEWQVEKCAKNH